ncbi:MAG: hypothetical protein WCC55_08935 [Nitrosotalea sp.]
MNKTRCKNKDLGKKELRSKQELRKIVCVQEENYLQELMLNSKRIIRMQDFISNLE